MPQSCQSRVSQWDHIQWLWSHCEWPSPKHPENNKVMRLSSCLQSIWNLLRPALFLRCVYQMAKCDQEPSLSNCLLYAAQPLSSALEKQHRKFAWVVQIETLIGLTSDLEAEAFAHDAVERLSVLSIHLFFHDFACLLWYKKERAMGSVTVSEVCARENGRLFWVAFTYLDIDTCSTRCLFNAVSDV